MRRWGSRECPVASGSRQCQVRGRTGSLGLQTPWSPEREVLLELRAAFWFISQSGFGADGNLAGDTARRGKGNPDVPSVGCWVQQQISQGQSPVKPKRPGGQRPAMNLLRMESHGQGSWHHWPRKPQVREAPRYPGAVPTTPSPRSQVSGWGLGASTAPADM